MNDLDNKVSNGTSYMEEKWKKQCIKIVSSEKKIVDCLSKSKYGSFVDKSESNPTI